MEEDEDSTSTNGQGGKDGGVEELCELFKNIRFIAV